MVKKIGILIILAVLFADCSRVPVTRRKQFRMLPESMINSMSLTTYNQFIASSNVVQASDARTQQVTGVGKKLQNATIDYLKKHGYGKRIKQFSWAFSLVEDPTVNAFCLPGGKVVIYSGILPVTQTDAGLATVMSHEIAHAVARHGNERMSQQLVVVLGGVTLAVAMQNNPKETQDVFNSVYGIGGALGILAYSRKHEYEADKIGMVFMALAGYDPAESIAFWERMAASGAGANIPQFLSTHPSDENRIKAMKEFLPTAKTYYKPAQ
ncbi:Beta-barrel assembly-enhancing protease [bioreactor metagenome]|uniref:Beta-barrel assembly-enhancing protease n=1 Tax=bioreactor metagenome TaxID=1076179 RepID=A0A644X038_9ZZZZ